MIAAALVPDINAPADLGSKDNLDAAAIAKLKQLQLRHGPLTQKRKMPSQPLKYHLHGFISLVKISSIVYPVKSLCVSSITRCCIRASYL